ncbi:hypothetical protein [Asaia astilbis]|uniref:hypothetical protein n=1 Tax=Asaia astilbis TaxID=610244 RepID=UPI000565E2AE|nr:hypothetical protein [Asaia astilbis]
MSARLKAGLLATALCTLPISTFADAASPLDARVDEALAKLGRPQLEALIVTHIPELMQDPLSQGRRNIPPPGHLPCPNMASPPSPRPMARSA